MIHIFFNELLIHMALRSIVYKAVLQVSDMDRQYYAEHPLTIARHPSETEERVMVRVLAFALHAEEHLVFGRGLSADDEADIWSLDLTGAITLWIDVGMPDERLIRKAAGRSDKVVLYVYGRAADVWWNQHKSALAKISNLSVYRFGTDETLALAELAQRTMQVQCTIEDNEIWVTTGDAAVRVVRESLQQPR